MSAGSANGSSRIIPMKCSWLCMACSQAPLPPAFVADDNENLVDDTELTAVITAALMAYLGSGSGEKPAAYTDSADGLVVRSIRRVR